MSETPTHIWKNIPLSELWKQPKEFIYWFLHKYYEVNINKQACTDDEWSCVIKFLKSHYAAQFHSPIASFYLQFGDFEKTKDIKPNDYDGAYTLTLEKINHAGDYKIWCGRFKKKILPVYYRCWTKAPGLPESAIRRMKGDLYYLEEDGDEIQYAGVYGNVTLESIGFITESDLMDCRYEFNKVYLGLFDSRNLRKRQLFPEFGMHEYSDLLDFVSPPIEADYLPETKTNRIHFEGYLTDLFIESLNSEEHKNKLVVFAKSAKTLGVFPHLETIISRYSKPMSISANEVSQLIELLSEIKQQTKEVHSTINIEGNVENSIIVLGNDNVLKS